MDTKYVVNFLRDRDSYQLPAALHEHGILQALITDIYFDSLPELLKRPLARFLSDHRSADLEGAIALNSLIPTILQVIDKVLIKGRLDISYLADIALDRRTGRYIKRNNCSALLYSGYAADTFRLMEGGAGKRILFMFHPHHALVSHLLEADAASFPTMRASFLRDRELAATWRHQRADYEVRKAQGILAASSFTLKSANYAGFRGVEACAPYFTKFSPNLHAKATRNLDAVSYLFVGQGIQRKGLHHLFRAWSEAKLPNATLTCICSRIDDSIRAITPPDVLLKPQLSREGVVAEFDRANVFVMPSIVEGFGLVYLEAMRRGAYVIGTENTGLPDLRAPSCVARTIEAGSTSAVYEALKSSYEDVTQGKIDPALIVDFSLQQNSKRYSEAVANALKIVEQH